MAKVSRSNAHINKLRSTHGIKWKIGNEYLNHSKKLELCLLSILAAVGINFIICLYIPSSGCRRKAEIKRLHACDNGQG
jgi:hypothetical protein